jgi:hypothetical protein
MSLWICKNCETVGSRGASGWYSSAPACNSCGHRTTLPVDSPKGAELAERLGITSDKLRSMEWRSFSYSTRIFWLLTGSAWTATCLTGKRHDLGVTGSLALFSALWAVVSILLHFLRRPKPIGK